MHLEDCPLKFSTITHHASVTQCLGSIGGHPWYLGVAKLSIVGPTDEVQKVARLDGKNIKDSRWGHSYVPPAVDDVHVFRIEGSKFLKLNRGTWHAGPLFRADAMDFYNLELSNTNVSPLPSPRSCLLPLVLNCHSPRVAFCPLNFISCLDFKVKSEFGHRMYNMFFVFAIYLELSSPSYILQVSQELWCS